LASIALGLALLSWPQIVHATTLNNETGLPNPLNVITFEEIVLAPDTPLTDQYAGLGVTFSEFSSQAADLFYDGVEEFAGDRFPNMRWQISTTMIAPATSHFRSTS